MAKAPILDLSTLTEGRPPIRVDGVVYHLKSPDELTLIESHWFTMRGKEIEELAAGADLVALEGLVRVVAKAALADMPGDVFERLSATHHMEVAEVFTALLLGRRIRLAGALAGMSRPIGVTSSRASSAPMAASQDGGSTVRQQPS
jgi:hypothetical protein